MILIELYQKDEIKTMNADGYVVSVCDFSSPCLSPLKIEDINWLTSNTVKPVFLKLLPLYHDQDYAGLKKLLQDVRGIKGLIFEDLGLIPLVKELNIDYEMIYDPGTFNTVKEDALYFKNTRVACLTISREISLKEIDNMLVDNQEMDYAYHAYGYLPMFYSLRKHLDNFSHYEPIGDLNFRNDLSIKEETRQEHYPIYEDNYGFYVFRDKIQNIYDFVSHFSKIKYLILDRIFIDKETYQDVIDLYMNRMKRDDFLKNHPLKFDTGFLFKAVGKGD